MKKRSLLPLVLVITFIIIPLVNTANADATPSPTTIVDENQAVGPNVLLQPDISTDWWTAVQTQIRQSEYNITWQDQAGAYQSPNRANDFRVFYTADGIRIIPRSTTAPAWELNLSLSGSNLANTLTTAEPAISENTGSYQHGRFLEQYTNNEWGLMQSFTIAAPPDSLAAGSEISFDFQISGDLTAVLTDNGQAVRFSAKDGTPVLRYVTLSTLDETAASLPSQLSLLNTDKQTILRLTVNTETAVFPLTLRYRLNSPTAVAPTPQRLSNTANWTFESNDAGAELGYATSTAGDVNGDGYDDIMVGAWRYDNGQPDEGQVFVFYGSATGPGASANWIAQSNQDNALFGHSLGTAGDINGDGYADIIIGADMYENPADVQINEGAAFVFLGSAAGLGSNGDPTNADWSAESNQANAQFGISARSAGDVNGDGYSDVIIGAYNYDNTEVDEGAVFVYYGSNTGLGPNGTPINADWSDESNAAASNMGHSAGTAGDVNGDGYGDIIVGAYLYDNSGTNDGRVYAYYGSASGPSLSADLVIDSGQAGARFGVQVSTAGDVNGDGYSDIIVGANGYDNGEADEGGAFLYLGSSTGLSGTAAWTAESNQINAQFGWAVGTAGDVNGDGYADVIIGAPGFGDDFEEGGAFVYQGSAAGLGANGTPTNADWAVESNQANAQMGATVGIGYAGDVNGDGFADVLVGVRFYDNGQTNEGQALLFYGDSSGLSASAGWTAESGLDDAQLGFASAAAGDVNGDGYGDVIVGVPYFDNGQTDEGAAFVFQGSAAGLSGTADWTAESNVANANFGQSAASAGDVNGDGYADVIVGAPGYVNGETGEGAAYVFHGSSSGLNTTPNWTVESDLANADMGTAVAPAGDVNGDGYGDVIIGAPGYANGQTGEGAAYLYLGSASGLSAAQDWLAESNQAGANLGQSVNSAGDTNGDGYDDVIVGAPLYDNGPADEGAAFVYQGFASGMNTTAAWTAESNQANAAFGQSTASAGDVNGDGYSDVIIGAPAYTNGETGEGGAFVYEGSALGLGTNGTPGNADWSTEGNQISAGWGTAVATAGDVNGDGYDDVVVGVPGYTNIETSEGGAFTYLGSSTGLNTTADWTAESNQGSAAFGQAAASAGDVNGDGYDDVIIGAPMFTNGNTNEGSAFLYYGNEGDGLDLIPQPRQADNSAPILPGGQSISPTDVRLSLFGRVPFGRSQVKLEWEIKPYGTAFDGTGLGQSVSWSDSLVTGVSLNELATGLAFETRYRWRARLLAQPLNANSANYITYRSRWFYGDDFFTALSGQQVVSGVGQTNLLGQSAYINVTSLGTLSNLNLLGYPNTAHPQENFNGGAAKILDRYFTLTPNGGASGYNLTLCLNYDDVEVAAAGVTESGLRLCQWTGSGWACSPRGGDSSVASNLVCADGVNTFSDWVIGEVGPTAVNLNSLNVQAQSPGPFILLAILPILAGITVVIGRRRRVG